MRCYFIDPNAREAAAECPRGRNLISMLGIDLMTRPAGNSESVDQESIPYYGESGPLLDEGEY